MEYLIVSRHPAAVQFIRESDVRFTNALAVESTTADDVRGKIVADNLPLHLAALTVQVVAVEFDGAPPRGAEYGIAEMRAAGARLVAYTVAAIPAPAREIQYDDKIHEFKGATIPGIAAVKFADFTRNGKWSHIVILAPGAWSMSENQSWEEGDYFHRQSPMSSRSFAAPDARQTMSISSRVATQQCHITWREFVTPRLHCGA